VYYVSLTIYAPSFWSILKDTSLDILE
jgi:hypothetical protein